MKKIILWFLAASLLLSGCSFADQKAQVDAMLDALKPTAPTTAQSATKPEQTQPPAATAPVQTEPPATTAPAETESPAATVPAQTVPPTTAAPLVLDQPYYLPIAEFLGDAEFYDGDVDENGNILLCYSDADESAVEDLLFICTACGLFNLPVELEGYSQAYGLYAPGEAYYAITYLDAQKGLLYLEANPTDNLLYQAELDALLPYYDQELTFPAEFGKNVFPQFYASIGQSVPLGMQGSGVSHVFGGGAFWCEMYFDVSYDALRKYIDEMLLCGFDAWVVTGSLAEDKTLTKAVLQLSNGDADIVISYDAGDNSVLVYYESGTMWTILSGEDYARYIPQK